MRTPALAVSLALLRLVWCAVCWGHHTCLLLRLRPSSVVDHCLLAVQQVCVWLTFPALAQFTSQPFISVTCHRQLGIADTESCAMAGKGAGTSNSRSKPAGTAASSSCSKSSRSQQQSSRRRSTHSRNSSSSSRRRNSWQLPGTLFGGLSRQQLLLALLTLIALQAAVAVNIVYDETGWTKRDWHKYKIAFDMNLGVDPAEEVFKSADLRKHLGETQLNSLHGPAKQKAVSKYAG